MNSSKKDENVCPQNELYKNVHSIFISNSPKLKMTQVSTDMWMDEQTVVRSYDGILVGNKNDLLT